MKMIAADLGCCEKQRAAAKTNQLPKVARGATFRDGIEVASREMSAASTAQRVAAIAKLRYFCYVWLGGSALGQLG